MYWNNELVNTIIQRALLEDVGMGDITTDNLIEFDHQSEGFILAKEEGIIAGLNVAQMIFTRIDKGIEFKPLLKDGDSVKDGDEIAKLRGSTRAILKGERVALNFLQRLSGIATKTHHYVALVKDFPVRITDTRKTTPTLRILEKYAVTIGGGNNHRMGLYDAVMIKDNHIIAVGGILKAVNIIRSKIPHTTKIEVEVENMNEVEEALKAKVDIIMLDNMDVKTMFGAVNYINGRAIVEASGGITEENVRDVAKTGVDVISIGALTTHVKSLDISLELSLTSQKNRGSGLES